MVRLPVGEHYMKLQLFRILSKKTVPTLQKNFCYMMRLNHIIQLKNTFAILIFIKSIKDI